MIDILGGEVHVMATDDGINSAKISSDDDETSNNNNNNNGEMGGMPGGNMPATGTDGSVYINIVGGKTYVTVEGNDVDGIDSNGVLYIGGEAEVYASISSGDIYGNMATLDAEGSNSIVKSATVIATVGSMGGNSGGSSGGSPGGSSGGNPPDFPGNKTKRQRQSGKSDGRPNGNMGGMGGMGGMNESGKIYQPYIQTNVNNQNAGTEISVKNSNGDVIVTYTPNTSYSTILVTSPSMVAGESYTIVTGNDSTNAVASEASSGSVDSPSVSTPTDTITKNNSNSSTSNGYIIQPKIITILISIISFILFY